MRAGLIAAISVLLIACISQSVSERTQPRLTTAALPSPTVVPTLTEPPPLSDAEIAAVESRTQKFREKPPEFGEVDFANSTFPLRISGIQSLGPVKFKNGEYEYDSGPGSTGWISFDDALFIDINRDSKKEAVVLATHVQCGGSCDGGASLISIFSANGKRPVLLDQIETGSLGYGCGLRSLQIANKKITVEVFGNCRIEHNEMRINDNSIGNSKFQFSDTTKFVFAPIPKLKLQSREVTSTPVRSVMNYQAIVSVSDALDSESQ
jgi:hypothetical protein